MESHKKFILFEQRVEGDEQTPGNVKLDDGTGLRKMVDACRARAKQLTAAGCQCKLLRELANSGKGYGYRVSEPPPAEGQLGAQWNLLVLERELSELELAKMQMVGS